MEEKTTVREALEKAFEDTGNNFEEKEDTTPKTADTSINDAAEAKFVSGDESEEDTRKLDAESRGYSGNERRSKEPQREAARTDTVPTIPEDAPNFWKAEDKAIWSKVPPEVRPILKKYEDSRNAALARYKQAINDKVGQWADASFDEIFPQERMRALSIEGKTPAQATAALWAWNDYLEEDTAGAIAEIMARYELSPEDIYEYQEYGQVPQYQPQVFQDPRVDELLAQQQQQAEAAQAQQIKAQLDAFGSEQQNGKPLRPYWNEVKAYIHSILPLVYSENPSYTDYEALHAAYERAAYANPQVRTKLVNTSTQVKFSEDKTQRAKEAASASLTGSTSRTAEPPKTGKTARDALAMAWSEHSR